MKNSLLSAVALSICSLHAQEITGISLVNAETDQIVTVSVPENLVIDFHTLGTNELNFIANTDATVQSVRFSYDNVANFRTENSQPFAFNLNHALEFYDLI